MNKETKIGMLTGLGVIVLIGVLLSQYFERDNRTQHAAIMKDVGEGYRLAAAAPVGVPRVGDSAADTGHWSGGGDNGAPVAYATATGDATARGSAGPVVGAPVTATPVGRIPDNPDGLTGQTAVLPGTDSPSTGGVTPAVYVAGDPHAANLGMLPAGSSIPPTAAPAGTSYQIVKGDTLSGIALKFYHSSGKSTLARIVAANPTLLKNENTPLVMGKKLLIPAAPSPAVTPAAAPAHGPTGAAHPGLVIRPAGSDAPAGTHATAPAPAPIAAPQPAVKTYTVQKGDSLSKIAAKFLGSSSQAAQDKIIALNKMKGTGLQQGQVLKIPAKA